MSYLLAQIDPVAFRLGPIEVRWYGLIIAFGILLAGIMVVREGERRGIKEDDILDMMLWTVLFGLIGARIYYVLFELDYYLQNPAEIIAIWEGGIAIYGGIIGGALAIIWQCQKKNIPVWLMFDIAVPGLLVGQIVGRWGNFMNQEAHGGPVSRDFLEGLMLPDFIINQMNIEGVYYHPTFLYESVWNLVGLIIILALRHREGLFKRGEVALSYVIWYGIGRFWVEGMRTDSLYIWNTPIRVSQTLALVSVIVAIIIWIYRRRNIYPPIPDYMEGIEPELKFEQKRKEKLKQG